MLFDTKFLLVSVYQADERQSHPHTSHRPVSISTNEFYPKIKVSFRYICCDSATSSHLLSLGYTISLAEITKTISDTCQ